MKLAKNAIQNVIAFPRRASRSGKDETEFLPAALEIVETPPSPIGMAIGTTVIVLFCIALAWASFGTVDIVATAPGKIIPTGRTKVIQPFETGVVRAIHVRDGQSVKAGDLLIELDPTISGAELDHLKSDLASANLEVARLRAELSGNADPLDAFSPPKDAPPTLVEMNREFLISQTAEQRAKLAAIDGQLSQKEAERATTAATIAKIEATIPLLQQRVDIRKYLADKEFGSKLQYLTEMQDLVGLQQELLVQKSHIHEAESAVTALSETRLQTIAEFPPSRACFDELAKAEPEGHRLSPGRHQGRAENQTASAHGTC